ncbi:histone acetyltransferase type B catalytic subunit-like [Rhincodon typus]|uniref:histone acetyltransferase type B catalytic subunit-like n=1 Tax=Rhincodon typus TaxID=259920 RepID=UPI00202EBCA8|nr:histone acetyltransferase type B catalytic subunit-like [Rhincodon typus]
MDESTKPSQCQRQLIRQDGNASKVRSSADAGLLVQEQALLVSSRQQQSQGCLVAVGPKQGFLVSGSSSGAGDSRLLGECGFSGVSKVGQAARHWQSLFHLLKGVCFGISAEEPSEDFVKLRDFVLAKLCQELQAFAPEKLKKGFSAEMIEEARRTWKINKHHSRRVYEILRLRVTNMSDPVQSSEYRLDVKRRLAIPFKKNKKEATRLSRLMPEDWLAQQAEMSVSQEQEYLEETYQTTVEQYRRILERLARV